MENHIVEMTIPIVIIGCLIIGYLINNYLSFEVKNIPLTMAVVGALINTSINGSANIETSIVCGALNGLISTGLYETFKKMIKK